ncbi:unnamed protein product [Natator depressus]
MPIEIVCKIKFAEEDEKQEEEEEGDKESLIEEPSRRRTHDLAAFAGTCTLHGLGHICGSGRLGVRQTLWAFAFLLSLAFLLSQAARSALLYLERPHLAALDEEAAREMLFPAVTICNINRFRHSALSDADIFHLANMTGLPPKDREGHRAADLLYPDPDMADILNRTGHQLDDMLQSCNFSGEKCSSRNFTVRSQGRRSLQLDPGKEVVTSRRTGTLGAFPGNRGQLPGLRVASREMYAKRLKSDLVELCRGLARLRSSGAPAAVSEGGPKTARSFDKCLLAQRKEGEDIDSFLTAFENACELHRVDPADRLQFLTPLLDPKAVEVYSRMTGAEAGDYELFKQALLREFGLTPEMYRRRFRSQRKTPEVTYLQLVNRMQGYARKWTAGAQTKEDLLDLFVLEHLYEQCPSDLRLWLVDKKLANPQHAGQLADEFVNSWSGGSREESQKNRPPPMQRESHHGASQRGNRENPLQRGTPGVGPLRPVRGDQRDLSCYHCGVGLRKDPSLQKLRDLADLSEGRTMRRGCQERFLWEKGFLYREWAPPGEGESCGIRRQLVVPQKYRRKLLSLAHDIPLAGHQGIRRTRQRLLQNFYWPGVFTTVRQYCRSCDPCQRVGKARDKGKAALRPLPIIEEPFQKVAMDIVGPLSKTTRSGKKYILVVVDFATRYPEAVPLASIEADTVADALLTIFSRVGFPREVLTDQGSNFMSALLRCLWEKCGVRHDWASAYHPQSNGLGGAPGVYRIFAFRTVIWKEGEGPLDLMRDEWEGKATPDGESVVEYVLTFRERLAELMGLARENLARAQRKQKVWYDRTARARAYATGDQVMVLIPVRKNKLQAAWEGPFKVVKQLNEVNYVVELSNRAHHRRVYHVNMMKPYYARGNVVLAVCGQWEEQGDDPLVDLFPGTRAGSPLETIPLSDQLTPAQQAEVRGVLHPYRQLFSNQPGRTNLTVHRVQTGSHPPIRCSPFRVTGKTAQDLEREVRDMLALGVIQPSASPWASPVVLVPKKDGSVRFCVDYRKLNAITVSDAYPMPRPDELLDKLGGARYLTTMDLTKGYWQVPLDADARLKSAFITPLGLYEFLTLPFGLKGAPATFQRLVDQLLRGMESFAVAYIDDICVFSQTWEDHVSQVRQVLDRLQGAGLTVKAEKCKVGMAEVSYLGHRVGSGRLKPEPAKVEVIRDWPAPHTKKQVQAFMGMAGYYRRFVPHFSAIATPITELCKKGKPDKVVWTEQCQEAFRALKEALVSGPVLANPDFDKPFVVFTDASDTGLGAVLMQEDEKGERHPIVYLSKKLLPRERHYAAIEKECLAMVWALKKLEPYLFGRHFTVYTDHSPLTWLHQMKGANAKLLRWSLLLQDYDMDVVHVKGSANLIADALSRRGGPELPQVTGHSDPAQFSLEGGRDVTM